MRMEAPKEWIGHSFESPAQTIRDLTSLQNSKSWLSRLSESIRDWGLAHSTRWNARPARVFGFESPGTKGTNTGTVVAQDCHLKSPALERALDLVPQWMIAAQHLRSC